MKLFDTPQFKVAREIAARLMSNSFGYTDYDGTSKCTEPYIKFEFMKEIHKLTTIEFADPYDSVSDFLDMPSLFDLQEYNVEVEEQKLKVILYTYTKDTTSIEDKFEIILQKDNPLLQTLLEEAKKHLPYMFDSFKDTLKEISVEEKYLRIDDTHQEFTNYIIANYKQMHEYYK